MMETAPAGHQAGAVSEREWVLSEKSERRSWPSIWVTHRIKQESGRIRCILEMGEELNNSGDRQTGTQTRFSNFFYEPLDDHYELYHNPGDECNRFFTVFEKRS